MLEKQRFKHYLKFDKIKKCPQCKKYHFYLKHNVLENEYYIECKDCMLTGEKSSKLNIASSLWNLLSDNGIEGVENDN